MTDPVAHGPLAGTRVLELGSTVAGPFCGRLFADFGADVVKVELPERRPGALDGAPRRRRVAVRGEHPAQQAAGRDRPSHRRRAGTRARTRAARRRRHRELPSRHAGEVGTGLRVARGAQPAAGHGAHQRLRAGRAVRRTPRLRCDRRGGQRAAFAHRGPRTPARADQHLAARLHHRAVRDAGRDDRAQRARTHRRGQVVDAALYECAFSFVEPHVPAFERLGAVARRSGSALPGSAPNNLYEAADGGHVHVTAVSGAIFRRLCEATASPGWPTTRASRAPAPEPPTRARSTRSCRRGSARAAPSTPRPRWSPPRCRPHASTRSRTSSPTPHDRARGMLAAIPSRELGRVTRRRSAPVRALGRLRHAGGPVGGDTRRTRSVEPLGPSDERLDALERAGVVRSADASVPGGDATGRTLHETPRTRSP